MSRNSFTVCSAAVLLLIAFAAVASALQTSSVCVAPNGVNLNSIAPATYSGVSMAGVRGLANVTVDFGWCGQKVSSATCNVTNASMVITYDGMCVASFDTIYAPIVNVSSSAVEMRMWSARVGGFAYATVQCNAAVSNTTAVIVGTVINTPIYTYTLTFASSAACI